MSQRQEIVELLCATAELALCQSHDAPCHWRHRPDREFTLAGRARLQDRRAAVVDCEGEITNCHTNCLQSATCAELEATFCSPSAEETTLSTCLNNCDPQFTCTSGETIDGDWQCDGTDDCADGSDEAGCPDVGTFACQDGNGTVPLSWQCDGEPDCSDGSDEAGCPAQPQEAELVCPTA